MSIELVNTPRRLLLCGAGAALVAATPLARARLGDRSTVDVTEGPYFVDELLNRADIRVDPTDGSTQDGLLLLLSVTVSSLDTTTGVTKPLPNAMVDIWHCNALGLYSDVSANNTVGRKFLRGYQLTDKQGKVQFRSIYPGWYSGRAPHIHCKVRQVPTGTGAAASTTSLTTQFFFDESLTQLVYADTNYPYYPHGMPDMTHAIDQVYQGSNSCSNGAVAGDSLKLTITRTAKYASARFDILIDTGSRCTSTETGMGGGGAPGGPGGPGMGEPGAGGMGPTPPTP